MYIAASPPLPPPPSTDPNFDYPAAPPPPPQFTDVDDPPEDPYAPTGPLNLLTQDWVPNQYLEKGMHITVKDKMFEYM